jgi:hypothetical protein
MNPVYTHHQLQGTGLQASSDSTVFLRPFCPLVYSPGCILILPSFLSLDLARGHFPSEFLTTILSSSHFSMRATCPTHIILVDLVTLILSDQSTTGESLIMLHPPHISYPSATKVFLSTLSWDPLNPCSVLSVRGQVSRPYKVKSKNIGLHIQIFKFSDSRQEDQKILKGTVANIHQIQLFTS